jgi:hypothetical protein
MTSRPRHLLRLARRAADCVLWSQHHAIEKRYLASASSPNDADAGLLSHKVMAKPTLGGLHHEYRLERLAA